MGAFRGLVSLLCGAAALAAPAFAAEALHYGGVDTLAFKNMIGAIEIKADGAGGDVELVVTKGADADYQVHIERAGGVLTLRSDVNPDLIDWRRRVGWRLHRENAFDVFLQDYPRFVVTVPAGTDLSFDSAVVLLNGGDTKGALAVRGGHVDGAIGDLSAADITIHGSGDLIVGDVAGALDIGIHGSGDFAAGAVGAAAVHINGSGDVTIGDAAGDVSAQINGSGDVRFGTVLGSLAVSCHGSGDIFTGDVGGGAEIRINGSGDTSLAAVRGGAVINLNGSGGVELTSLAGRADVIINGSGDVRIADGRAEPLRVRTSGSGDFDFQGVAVDPDVSAGGSSSIHIRRHEGSVRVAGRGDVRIGAVRYNKDN